MFCPYQEIRNWSKLNYSIVGGWKTGTVLEKGDTILIFNEDGIALDRFEMGEITSTGTWELNNDILNLNLTDNDNNEWSFTFKIHFQDKGKLLIAEELDSGNVEIWERV